MKKKGKKIKLKPCPFCGSEDTEIEKATLPGGYGEIGLARGQCTQCLATGPRAMADYAFEAEKLAIAAWNRRAGEQE